MRVALTGSTGFIGSHILETLVDQGHEVVALVRDDEQADNAGARGAKTTVTDLFDPAAVAAVLRGCEGAIHTASPGDATSAAMDSAVLEGGIDAFDGTDRPYLQISGVWVYGDGAAITEDTPFKAPALVAWRAPIEQRLLSTKRVRGIVPVSGVAYGDGGGGVPGVLLSSPRDEEGNLIMLGSGQQHWSTVHVADIADFFCRALENDAARGYYVLGNGANSTVAEITEAAAVAVGAPGAVPGSAEEARQRLGDYFAEVLLLDQSTQAARARIELGWTPSHPSLVDELRRGSYRA